MVELTNGGPDNDIITDYFWEYGDGTSEHTTTPTTEHTYGLGTFVPTLTVTDQNNCTATREGPEISTGYQILPEYFSAMDSLHNEIPKGIVCVSDTIILYNEMYEDHDTLDYTFIIVMNENPYEESSQETYTNIHSKTTQDGLTSDLGLTTTSASRILCGGTAFMLYLQS